MFWFSAWWLSRLFSWQSSRLTHSRQVCSFQRLCSGSIHLHANILLWNMRAMHVGVGRVYQNRYDSSVFPFYSWHHIYWLNISKYMQSQAKYFYTEHVTVIQTILKNNTITVHKAIEKAVPELFLETIFNAVESQKAPYIVTIFSLILKFSSENRFRSYCLGCYIKWIIHKSWVHK